MPPAEALHAQPLMRPRALVYFYRRRLRVHAVQELLAGAGVAVSVALVFATIVASASVAGSASEVVHTVIGPAQLQLLARGPSGMPESLLPRVQDIGGVAQAAPLLEQTATVVSPTGAAGASDGSARHSPGVAGSSAGARTVTVDLAGADTSLVVLDGLAHTLPTKTLSAGGIGLSRHTAEELGIKARALPGTRGLSAPGAGVTLRLRGGSYPLQVSAVLGSEVFGALAQAQVAVMPLEQLQRLAGMQGRVSRILVQAKPGREASVRAALRALAGGRLSVAPADQDVSLLHQALRPSDQASALFATVSALLGLLLAGSALLLTVPERRRAIADLRLIGAKRSAIAQMFLFQALVLGSLASLIGLAVGYALSLEIFHQSPRYLAEAFTLGNRTVLSVQPAVLAFAGGVLATCAISALPLLDLRRGKALDAVYRGEGVPGNALANDVQRGLAIVAAALLAAATALFLTSPSRALVACTLLALATVLSVPLAFAGVLRAASATSERYQRLTILPVALASLRATTLRSLALAATGAVALFGSVALGGSRADLLRGIEDFAHDYSHDAPIWVGSSSDDQAAVEFQPGGLARKIATLPGVAGVRVFQGGFIAMDGRRAWILARPPGGAREVLGSQIVQGSITASQQRLAEGGWTIVSRQIAEALHVGIGGTLTLPTPTGPARLRLAATTTNLAWSPGVVFLSAADYRRLFFERAADGAGGVAPSRRRPNRDQPRDRAHTRTEQWAELDDRAGAPGQHRCPHRRRARPVAPDLADPVGGGDPGDGCGADLRYLVTPRRAGRTAAGRRQTGAAAPDPAVRIGAHAGSRLRHRRAGRHIRPGDDRRLSGARHRLSGGKPRRRLASARDLRAGAGAGARDRGDSGLSGLARVPDPGVQ